MEFTPEEFDIMVQELLYQKPVSFQMLCSIARRTLEKSVHRWCNADDALRGRYYEEDILQDICLRLIQTTVTSFLLREGPEGPVNLDPAGFRSWMFRVAKNLTIDFASKVRRVRFYTVSQEEIPDVPAEAERRPEPLLCAAIKVVLDGKAGIHITLTWLAQSIFVLEHGLTRIHANRLLEEQFSRKTLDELWELVQAGAEKISWLQITPAQKRRIRQALDRPYDSTRSYGRVRYEEFYMKKGGRASISDWVNRIDEMVKRQNSENLV